MGGSFLRFLGVVMLSLWLWWFVLLAWGAGRGRGRDREKRVLCKVGEGKREGLSSEVDVIRRAVCLSHSHGAYMENGKL